MMIGAAEAGASLRWDRLVVEHERARALERGPQREHERERVRVVEHERAGFSR